MQYCYYCDTEFADMKALQDHMKAMHLRCHVSHYPEVRMTTRHHTSHASHPSITMADAW